MPGYKTFGQPDPEADIDILRSRVGGANVMLEAVVHPLVSAVYDRVEEQEDTLREVYRPLIDYGRYLTDRTDAALGTVVADVRQPLATALSTVGAQLAATDIALGIPDESTTNNTEGRSDVIPTDPGAPVHDVPESGTPPPPITVCPPGFDTVRVPATGELSCRPGRPVPVSPVPPPVPPVPGRPVPSPDPELCLVGPVDVDTGTLPCDTALTYWLYVDCSDPTAIQYRVVASVPQPPQLPGWSLHGPWLAVPTPEQMRDAATACVRGTPPALPTPTPPGEPTPPGTPAPPAPPAPPGEGDYPPDAEAPDAPPLPPPVCNPIVYVDPKVCDCVGLLILHFAEFGHYASEYYAWLMDEAKDQISWDVGVLEAAALQTTIKMVAGKLSFTDPTAIAVAQQISEIARKRMQLVWHRLVMESYASLHNFIEHLRPEVWKPLLGCYLAKGYINLLSQHSAGATPDYVGLPNVTIDWVHVHTLVDMCIQYLTAVELPHVAVIEDLWRAGMITDTHAECLLRMHGQQWGINRRAWEARSNTVSGTDLVQYHYRERPPEGDLQKLFRRVGYVEPSQIEILRKVNEYLPPPSDAIRMAVKDAFDPNKLGRAEMLAEFKEQVGLKETFEAIGLEDTVVTTKDGRKFAINTPELYWLSSYEEASPTQVYEMLHRLRPDRVKLYELPDAAGKVTTPEPVDITTVRKLLKEKDYNPIWRDRLAAISYRVIGRIDIRRMYALGVFGKPLGPEGWNHKDLSNPVPLGVAEKEVVERFMDQGSNAADARIQGYYVSVDFALGKVRKTQVRKQAAVIRSYRAGVIGIQDAITRLTEITGSRELADDLVTLADVDTSTARVEEVTRAIRSRYLSFKISRDEAKQALNNVGVKPFKVADLLATWDIRLAGRHKELSAASLCGYYAVGLITRDDFLTRLVRSGYDPGEANRIVRKCEIGEAAKSAKEFARQEAAKARERKLRDAAIAKLAKEAETQAAKDLAKRLSAMNDKHLTDWYKAGLITHAEIRTALLLKGWRPVDVERWILTYARQPEGDEGGQQ